MRQPGELSAQRNRDRKTDFTSLLRIILDIPEDKQAAIDMALLARHDSSMRTSSRQARAEVENSGCVFQGASTVFCRASLDARLPIS